MSFDPKKPRILVALGGRSPERAVSIETGKNVALALEKLGYPLGLFDTGTGKLMQSPELDTIETDPKKLPSSLSFPLVDIKRHFQLVFIALHGKFGEDGGIQALLEEIGIKYTGSNPSASAASFDKRLTKTVFQAKGIPTPDYQVVRSENDKVKYKFPVVVKPVAQGSSVGVSICSNEADLKVGIKSALAHDSGAMIEPFIEGREITVGILDDKNDNPKALPVIEIRPTTSFFDYKAKYDPQTQEIVPAKISKELTEKAQRIAVEAHTALCASQYSRVDMIITDKGDIQVLELNTLPGLTSNSLFPKAAKASGIKFENLVENLVKNAIKS